MAKKTATKQPKKTTSKPRRAKAETYPWLRRINARRTLDRAILLLGKYDFEGLLGVDLKRAVAELRAASKKAASAS